MKRSEIIILLLAVFIGGLLVFYDLKSVSNSTQNDSDILNNSQKWESKIDDKASVVVTVIPSDLSMESREWKFDVAMNTHSVELDQDIIQVAMLVEDFGKEYKPLRWEGAPAGGHHREGILIFAPITPYPQHLTLIVNDVGGVQRSFTWTLIE